MISPDSEGKRDEKIYMMRFGTNQDLMDKNYQEIHHQFGAEKVFDLEQLAQFFKFHPSIIRAKGFIQTKAGWHLFNFTFSGITFEPCIPKLQNEFIFIAENNGENLQSNLNSEIINSMIFSH